MGIFGKANHNVPRRSNLERRRRIVEMLEIKVTMTVALTKWTKKKSKNKIKKNLKSSFVDNIVLCKLLSSALPRNKSSERWFKSVLCDEMTLDFDSFNKVAVSSF